MKVRLRDLSEGTIVDFGGGPWVLGKRHPATPAKYKAEDRTDPTTVWRHVDWRSRDQSHEVDVVWTPPTSSEVEHGVAPPGTELLRTGLTLLTTDKAARKQMPIARGVVDYFPRALAAVAHVSFKANEQHNPGEPMHWDKTKSTDHADCIARHLIERGAVDDDGLRHSAKLAWRALALLETELEAAGK